MSKLKIENMIYICDMINTIELMSITKIEKVEKERQNK